MLTKNSERTLADCLRPLAPFGEILVLDTGSTDSTLDILHAHPNVRLLQGTFENFGTTRNQLAAQAANDWILVVDSDEMLTPELIAEIAALPLDAHEVYSLLRINHYHGRPIRGCRWHPDYCDRLYNRRAIAWNDSPAHSCLELPAGIRSIRLQNPMNHFSFTGAEHYMSKMIWYAQLFAETNKGKRRGGTLLGLLHGGWTFFRCYVLNHGFLYGYDGLEISWISARGSFLKYHLLK